MAKTVQFHLSSSTIPEMRAFALNELGLTLAGNLRADNMRQRIIDSALSQDINIVDNSQEKASETKMKSAARSGSPHSDNPDLPLNGRIKILIQKSDERGGGRPVPVGFQGRMYTVPRGIPVSVPAGVEHILYNAVKDVIEDDLDKQERIVRRVQAYPYQILEGHENLKPPLAERSRRAEAEAMASAGVAA